MSSCFVLCEPLTFLPCIHAEQPLALVVDGRQRKRKRREKNRPSENAAATIPPLPRIVFGTFAISSSSCWAPCSLVDSPVQGYRIVNKRAREHQPHRRSPAIEAGWRRPLGSAAPPRRFRPPGSRRLPRRGAERVPVGSRDRGPRTHARRPARPNERCRALRSPRACDALLTPASALSRDRAQLAMTHDSRSQHVLRAQLARVRGNSAHCRYARAWFRRPTKKPSASPAARVRPIERYARPRTATRGGEKPSHAEKRPPK